MRVNIIGQPTTEQMTDQEITSLLESKGLATALGSPDGKFTVITHEIESPKKILGAMISSVSTPDDLAGGYVITTTELPLRNAEKFAPVTKWKIIFNTGLIPTEKKALEDASTEDIKAWLLAGKELKVEDPMAAMFADLEDFEDFDDEDENEEPEIAPSPVAPESAAGTPEPVVERESLIVAPTTPTVDSEPEDDGFPTAGVPEIAREDVEPELDEDGGYVEPITEPEPYVPVSQQPVHSEAQLLAPVATPDSTNQVIREDVFDMSPKGRGGQSEGGNGDPRPERQRLSVSSDTDERGRNLTTSQKVAMENEAQRRRDTGFLQPSRNTSDVVSTGRGANQRNFAANKGKVRSSRVTCVTGAAGGVGKSSVSWMLARSTARVLSQKKENKPVFLIETDIANPKLASNIEGIPTNKNVLELAKEVLGRKKNNLTTTPEDMFAMVKSCSYHVTDDFYVLPAPYDLLGVDDRQLVEAGVKLALQGLASIKCEVFLDSTEQTGDAMDPFSALLSGRLSDEAVIVGGGSRTEEILRACKIISSKDRDEEDRKDRNNIHVIINRSDPQHADAIQRKLGKFQVRSIFPDLSEYLSDNAILSSTGGKGTSWVGSTDLDKGLQSYLIRLGLRALDRMGYFSIKFTSNAGMETPGTSQSSGVFSRIFGKGGKK